MRSRTGITLASLTTSVATAVAAGLLMPAADAATVFTTSQWQLDHYIWTNPGCTTTTTTPVSTPTPLPADGAVHTVSQSLTSTTTAGSDPQDVTTIAFSDRMSASLQSSGSEPKHLTGSFSGSTNVTKTKTPGVCKPDASLWNQARFAFTLTRATWVDIAVHNRGATFSEVYIWDSVRTPYVDLYGQGLKFDENGRALLPPGDYTGYLSGEVRYAQTDAFRTSGSGSMDVRFAPAGSRAANRPGGAKGYVTLPAMRNCGTHRLTPTITTNATRAKGIAAVTISDNGKVLKRITKPRKGSALPVGLSDSRPGKITATVKLRNGKTVKATASYLACS